MTTIADVQTEVDRVFDALNAPSWPDPHADNQIAAEEEYSRVTDPQRYRALVLRLQAWQQALSTLCDVGVDTTPEPGHTVSLPSGGNPEQGVR